MREPKRLAHRQAERNKARALKRWTRDDHDEEPATASTTTLDSSPEAHAADAVGEAEPVWGEV